MVENGIEHKQLSVTACNSIEQQYLVEDAKYGVNLRTFLDTYENAQTFLDFDIINAIIEMIDCPWWWLSSQ